MVNPVPGYSITTAYWKKGSSWSCGYHDGVDYAAPEGTKVVAMWGGVVVEAAYPTSFGPAFGRSIIIDHDPLPDGSPGLWGLYAHLSELNVEVGDRVEAGDQIGEVGTTGNSTGNHLHAGIYPDPYWSSCGGKNPDPWIKAATDGPYVTDYVVRSKCGYGEPSNGDESSDTVKELQERLNHIPLEGGQSLSITGFYGELTDNEVRLWQEQICGDTPDEPLKSFLGSSQFAKMFPEEIYELYDDGDAAIAYQTEEPPVTPEEPNDEVIEGYGFWDWYSKKQTGPVTITPGAGWTDLPKLVQPPSNKTGKNVRDHHFIYTRWELTEASTARRKAELRFVRSDGDETAYDHRLFDPEVSRSYPFPTYHTEAGSGLGGKWQAKITGGSDPATITTHYAKTEIEWQEEG